MESKFKIGDRVRFKNPDFPNLFGEYGTVTEVDAHSVRLDTGRYFYKANVELVEEPSTSKDTNPKDAIGSTKLDYSVVPDTLKTYAAIAFTEGALKYGSYNWRVAGVRASIYKAALERHLAKYWNGEWADPVTGVPHLASVIACAGIILDANAAGKLTDDRPPAIGMAGIIDGLEPAVKHLKGLFQDKNPHHHTELDKRPPPFVEKSPEYGPETLKAIQGK